MIVAGSAGTVTVAVDVEVATSTVLNSTLSVLNQYQECESLLSLKSYKTEGTVVLTVTVLIPRKEEQ